MRVYRDGDAAGKPFIFPRPIIHITDELFRTPGHEAFLEEACGVAAAKGNPCFVLDRERGTPLTPCGCPVFEGKEAEGFPYEPWMRRCASIQNVTLNLPRLGYRAGEGDRALFCLLDEAATLAAAAHVQKRAFIEQILALGDAGPLAMLAMQSDGAPYLRMADAAYLIGVTGLNELVQIRKGRQLHESDEALAYGLQVIGHLREVVDNLCKTQGMRFVLEQTPAETTAYRFARLDLKHLSPRPGRYVRGDLAKGEIYYTNSTHLHPGAQVDPFTRVRMEGLFHPYFRAGAVTHVELGAAEPKASALAGLLIRAFKETTNNQIIFSPEFTVCAHCDAISRGLLQQCPHCGTDQVDGLARISQYFSRVSGWNRGKRAELRDRNRNEDYFTI